MKEIRNKIKCPHCSEDFELEDVFKEHLDEIRAQQDEIKAEKQKNLQNSKKIEEAEKTLEKQKKTIDDAKNKVELLETQIKDFQKDKDDAIKDAVAKSKDEIELKLKEDLKKQNEITLKKVIADETSQIEAALKDKYSKELQLAQESIPENVEKDLIISKRKISQYEKQISLLERKAKQGAVEAQGEAQEILIEKFLQKMFPQDTIVPVKKGARGADCKQIINEKQNKNIGSIIYESKDTQNFSEDWVEKLFKDMTNDNIGFGIIVTEAMPKDFDGGLVYRYEGRITICPMNKNSLRILAQAMRENILRVNKLKQLNQSADSTKDDLWNLITSDSFSMKLRRYVSFYVKEQNLIDKDNKAAILSIKNRQKILEDKKSTFFGIVNDISSIEGTLPENILEHDELMLLEE